MKEIIIALITPFLDRLKERTQRKKRATYLAVRIITILDDYIYKCRDVVSDDGTDIDGRGVYVEELRDEDFQPRVELPEIPTFPEDIDWESIDGSLMEKTLLKFRRKIHSANDEIKMTVLFACDPPRYEEIFSARQKGYAKIGLLAIQIVEELGKECGLSNQNGEDCYSEQKKKFKEKLKKIKRRS